MIANASHPAFPAQDGSAPPPCFHFDLCHHYAELEKQGKALCRACARACGGSEYPLRPPTSEPLYVSGKQLARQLEMIEPGRKGLNAREPSR